MAVVPNLLIKYLGHATFLITTPGGKNCSLTDGFRTIRPVPRRTRKLIL